MPIPVNIGFYLAMVVMRPNTLPSSNSFVNTFFFEDTAAPRSLTVVADDVEELLENFYNTVNGGASATIASQLSGVIDETLTEVRVYDLGVAAPRTPEIRGMGSWTVGGEGYPNEVAAVISYRSGLTPSPTGGTPVKTERGRLYIGPLAQDVGVMDAFEGDVHLGSGFILSLTESAAYLRDQTDNDLRWMQYSRKDDAFGPVIQGFVNNRFDTQRRRGADETTRTVW